MKLLWRGGKDISLALCSESPHSAAVLSALSFDQDPITRPTTLEI